MRELPSHGRCYAAFLLAYTARLKPVHTLDGWIGATLARSTIMAAASDLPGTAQILLDSKLAVINERVMLHEKLIQSSQRADRIALVSIASLFLKRFPPSWIAATVVRGEFLPELVPQSDLDRLAWLGSDLAPIILDVHRSIASTFEDQLQKQIGDAGELAVVSALERAGKHPDHVSLISDAYGYDIEYRNGDYVQRLEVKACVQTTADRVIVSRNEYEKAAALKDSWRLIQVTFSSGIIVKRIAVASDVLLIRELSADSLVSLAPPSTDCFRWVDSAEFRPPATAWKETTLRVADSFTAPLGKLAS